MNQSFEHIVSVKGVEPIRFRTYIRGKLPFLETNSAVKKALKRDQLFLNKKRANSGDWVHSGDVVELKILHDLKNINVELNIVYEDEFIIAINKPSGIISSGNAKDSIQKRLKHRQQMNMRNPPHSSLAFPLLIHRLDKATNGIILAAKTMDAKRSLDEAFSQGRVTKTYAALLQGHCEFVDLIIDQPIDGKDARTKIIQSKPTKTRDKTTLVYVQIETGRTHQIRKHLSSIGFPIVGDSLYNKLGLSFGKGLFLSSVRLQFEHPYTSQELDLSIDIPKKFVKYCSLV